MCILSTTTKVSWVNNHLSVKRPPKEGPYFKFLFRLNNKGCQLLDTALSLFSFFLRSLLCVICFYGPDGYQHPHSPNGPTLYLMLAFSANSFGLFWLLRFWVTRYANLECFFDLFQKTKFFIKKLFKEIWTENISYCVSVSYLVNTIMQLLFSLANYSRKT